jgi:hypothetical protein
VLPVPLLVPLRPHRRRHAAAVADAQALILNKDGNGQLLMLTFVITHQLSPDI